jgi:excisionase family DNA binding protein
MSNHTPLTPRGYVYRVEAASTLGVGVSTLYRMVRAGHITRYWVESMGGTKWPCYKVSELEAIATRRAALRVRKANT